MRWNYFWICMVVFVWMSGSAQAQVSVVAPESEPDAEQKPPPMTTSLQTTETVTVDFASSDQKTRSLDGESLQRKYQFSIAGSQIHLLDRTGVHVNTVHFPSEIMDATWGKRRIYVATRAHGIYVLKVDWMHHLQKTGHIPTQETPSRLYYDDPYLFVVYPQSKTSLYRFDATGVQLVRSGQWHKIESIVIQQSREKASGRVLHVRGGKVIMNLGQQHGFKPGDRVRILSQGRGQEYNPLDGQQHQDLRLKLRAVLVLDEVHDTESIAQLERGLDIRVGDLVQYFGEEKTPNVERILRWGNTLRLIANVLPGFLVGDPMLGLDLRFEYQLSMPLTLGIGMRTFLGDETSALGLKFDVAYDTDYFALGYQVDINQLSSADEKNIPVVATTGMFIRLGTLDGLHLLFNYRSNFQELYGLSGRIQLPGVRHNLFVMWDFSFGTYQTTQENGDEVQHHMNMGYFLLGDRICLWGNGGKNTLFANVYLGVQTVNLQKNNNTSFVIGGGVEYRF